MMRCYPSFDTPFVLETDASITGIGAILSQVQSDGQYHPVAFASRLLTAAERNYGITELEMLAVVWSITHFHSYLYGHQVTIYTDHSAVQAILNTPTPSGKHARWWSRVNRVADCLNYYSHVLRDQALEVTVVFTPNGFVLEQACFHVVSIFAHLNCPY